MKFTLMFHRVNTVIFCLLVGSLPIRSSARVVDPLRHIEGLTLPIAETAYRVKTARIILADYPLIRRDFPELRDFTEGAIDSWLLDHAAFVSKAQAKQARVNSVIEVQRNSDNSPVTVEAYRPQLYGRAMVFKAGSGLIDAKGTGAAKAPQSVSHSNGLATLGEVIREYNFQKKIQSVLDHSGSGFQTVESYAVIDWGFDERDEWTGKTHRAGSILRQAHARPEIKEVEGNHFSNFTTSRTIEEILRSYGITSSGDGASETREKINIQVAKAGEIIDFGAYLVKDRFEKITTAYAESYVKLMEPSKGTFVQPISGLALPISHWGATETGSATARYDNPWIWAHRLAADLKSGAAQRVHVTQHFNDMMNSGSLSEALRGKFAYAQSQESRRKIVAELLSLNDTPHIELLTEFAKLNSTDVLISKLKEILKQERYAFYNIQVLNLLSSSGTLDKHPEILDLIALNSNWDHSGEILQMLINKKRFSTVTELLSVPRIWDLKITEFLLSQNAKSQTQWLEWLKSAVNNNPNIKFDFLSRKSSGEDASELFKYTAKTYPQSQRWLRELTPSKTCGAFYK